MITVREVNERTLSTPQEIGTYLSGRYAAMTAAAILKPGDRVDIASRTGLPPNLGVGDVAVVVGSMTGTPFTHCLMLNDAGVEAVVQVITESLRKQNQA